MRLLADLGVRTHVLDDAEFILESAVEFEPKNHFARFDYLNVLYRRQKYDKSLAQAQILLDSEPENPEFKIAFANQCVAVGRFKDALEIYDESIRSGINDPGLHLVRGHALKTIGQLNDAIKAYQQAYKARPEFGDAYWSLANLKTYRFTHEEIQDMEIAESGADTPLDDRIHLCFALGKAHEDRGNITESAACYLRGNALKKDEVRYDPVLMTRRLALQAGHCTHKLFHHYSGCGDLSPDPIFIVGLPRAGSTLIEQILASHSQVDGTLELPNVTALAQRLDGRRKVTDEPRYPGNLAGIDASKYAEFGKQYIEDTKIHRQHAAYFVDKMPNNFRHLGLIRLMLPNAKVIDARRHPMGCCFSGFKQLFASGQEFTYGLTDIGNYYRDYVDLMDHWDEALPGWVLRVQYEDVVENIEHQVRRILEYCGLPFEQACVDFHATDRSIRTPSSEQVRQPIYQSGLEQWRAFEAHLEPLKEALGPIRNRYNID
jgi:tetratricopeptide (TPR) repeat protein